MDKGQIAKEFFLTGINCSQSVVLAFKDEIGLDEQALKKLSIGYGGGVGRQREVCGAVLGMTMVLSYLLSDGNDKMQIYSIIQRASRLVKEQLGSIICRELLDGVIDKKDNSPKPEERTENYYKKRPCAEIVEIVANITEEVLNETR